MLRLLRFLITGDWHIHNWKIIEKFKIVDDWGDIVEDGYVLQCTHCGNIKKS